VPVTRTPATSDRPHRSAVAALLADNVAAPTRPAGEVAREATAAGAAMVSAALEQAGQRAAQTVAGRSAAAPAGSTSPAVRLDPGTGLPPIQDVALGAAAVIAEQLWRAGSMAVAVGRDGVARAVAFVRAVSPQVATAQADARLQALAERGQRIRQDRAEALAAALTTAMSTAATSDAVREMTVAAIEEATDDVLDVVLPALLEAVTEMETQEKLDELMSGLLLRQLPSALERTLPGVMLRTATKPALGLVPSLMGALASGLSGESGSADRG
jgi:hypothetical protein